MIAGLSDWGVYGNAFCTDEDTTGLGVLRTLLAEVWDFDSDIATPPLATSQVLDKPIRAYFQNPAARAGGPLTPGSTVIDCSPGRWDKYVNPAAGDIAEIPPLPPLATNSNSDTSKNGSGSRIHHLIRDFMFLDATAQNVDASGPPPILQPRLEQTFTARFRALDPADFASDDPRLGEFTRGTGRLSIANKQLIDIGAAPPETSSDKFVFFRDDQLSFSALLYELVENGQPVDGGAFSPNWFGVAVPDGITDFTNVVIYFHPTTNQAGYNDNNYRNKDGGNNPPANNPTYWKELLGYVDRLGAQLAGAIKQTGATPNQVVIIPLMRNNNVDAAQASTSRAGILPRQWYYIVNDILADLPTRLASL